MTPMPTLALAALLGVLPWAAVQDTGNAPAPVPLSVTVDARQLFRDIDGKADRWHRHGVDAITGLPDAVKAVTRDELDQFAKEARVVRGAWSFRPGSATEFRAAESMKISVPLEATSVPGAFAGIRIGPVGVDSPALVVTSDVYADAGAGKIGGFTGKTFGLYAPPGYRVRIASGADPNFWFEASPEGVVAQKVTAKTYVGMKSLARLEWRIPADRLKAGTVDADGPEFLPYEGSLAKVSVSLVAPGLDPAKIPAGDVVIDVNADGQSVWAALQDRRPRINAATPSVLSLAAAPATQAAPGGLTTLVKEGSRITVDVDAAPAGWADLPRGAEVRVVAWFLVGLP